MTDRVGDLRVAQVGGSVAISAAGAVFTQLGCTVTVLPGPGQRPTANARLVEILDRSKQHRPAATPDALLAALGEYDVVLVDVSELSRWCHPDRIDAYVSEVERVNRSVWVTLSPFGLTGPLRGRQGSELTFMAAGGLLNYSPQRRAPGSRPIKSAGHQCSFVLGHIGALAALHAIGERDQVGHAVHADVSAQESVMVTGVFLECAHVLFGCAGPGGGARFLPPRGLYPCADGHVYLMTTEDHQWRACAEVIGHPELIERFPTADDRRAHGAELDELVSRWSRTLTIVECAARAQAAGIPTLPVNSAATLLADQSLVERGFFDTTTGEPLPRMPALRTSRPAAGPPPVREKRPRILDLTNVLAGPLACSWLGSMGAEVVKIEDPKRLDHYRRDGPFWHAERGLEHGAYFAAANYSKLSCALDLGSAAGRAELSRLVASSAMVIDNASQARSGALGLRPELMTWVPGGTALISSSAFGRQSPFAHYRAYGNNIQAAGGLIYLTRDESGTMQNVGTSWADPVTAAWIAIFASVQWLFPESRATFVDVAMVEVVAYQFADFFSWLARDGVERVGDANRLDGYGPHGVYRCRGEDRWIAVAVRTDEHWAGLASVLGPAVTGDRFRHAADRVSAQAELDRLLDQVCAQWTAEELFDRLQAAGVPAAPVWSAQDLVGLAHLRERGSFPETDHPVMGRNRMVGVPWRFLHSGPVPVGRARLVGEDTGTLLGR
jgi:crotonobetainyl-CoA:carnitine CoA-transferase CaiB-like acyl-CoA transferase